MGLVVELTNDLTPADPAPGGDNGLLGLRERATAVGGSLVAGVEAGRWRLRAELPLEAS